MPNERPPIANQSPTTRSRMSNRWPKLAGVDGRSAWERRRRDILRDLIGELGRPPSARDRALVANVASVVVRSEQLAAKIVSGEAVDDGELVRLSNAAARMFSALRAGSGQTLASPEGLGALLRAGRHG